jgi:predicted ATPase
MKTIIAKHFGPIVDSGCIEVHPLTVFCGNQGSGKSTLAKLISTFSWLEKSLQRGDIDEAGISKYHHFQKKYFGYHYLTNYFRKDTFLEYDGEAYHFEYSEEKLTVTRHADISTYHIPQIIYIPAERNFMIAVEDAEKIRNLPPSLSTLQEEYLKALKEVGSKSLPLQGFSIQYDKLNKITWLVGDHFKIRLHEAASGFQSLIPLTVVTDYLSKNVVEGRRRSMSAEDQERVDRAIDNLLKDKEIDEMLRMKLAARLSSYQRNDVFMNIVEEPEQNLFPSSQRQVLYMLLSALHRKKGNVLILTTHSPYVLNNIALTIKANDIKDCKNDEASTRLSTILPLDCCMPEEDVAIYEITAEGLVRSLEIRESVLTDNNFLNNSLEEFNTLYNDLLDIEDSCRQR